MVLEPSLASNLYAIASGLYLELMLGSLRRFFFYSMFYLIFYSIWPYAALPAGPPKEFRCVASAFSFLFFLDSVYFFCILVYHPAHKKICCTMC